MTVKCPRCKQVFDEKLNVCPKCGLERHILVLAQKSEGEKAALLEAERQRLEFEEQAKAREEQAKAAAVEAAAEAVERRKLESLDAEGLAEEKAALARAEAEGLTRIKLEKLEAANLELATAAQEKAELEKFALEKQALAVEARQLEEQSALEVQAALEYQKKREEELAKEAVGEASAPGPVTIKVVKVVEKALPKEKNKGPRKKLGKKALIFVLIFLLIAGTAAFFTWNLLAKAAQVNVEISSVPGKAEVYLDNVATGLKTPATLINVKLGAHALTLKLAGYADLATTLSVVAKSQMQQPAPFRLLRKVIPPLKIEVTPLTTGVRTMLPIRPIVEAIGGTILWVIPDKEVRISANGVIINLWINKNYDNGDGVSKLLDPTDASLVPVLVNGRTLLPIKFINEQFGITLIWNEAIKEATIKFKN